MTKQDLIEKYLSKNNEKLPNFMLKYFKRYNRKWKIPKNKFKDNSLIMETDIVGEHNKQGIALLNPIFNDSNKLVGIKVKSGVYIHDTEKWETKYPGKIQYKEFDIDTRKKVVEKVTKYTTDRMNQLKDFLTGRGYFKYYD